MTGKEKLAELRTQIDAIDAKLLPLFRQRMEIAEQVAEAKRASNMAIFDEAREAQILEKARQDAADTHPMETAQFMRTLLALSKLRQRAALFLGDAPLLPPAAEKPTGGLVCAYQGIAGAWGEQAAELAFPEAEKVAEAYFEDVFLAVREGRAHYGVVPIENSQTGAIGETYDLLRKYGCYIVGRLRVPIRQCLLAPKGAGLRNIRKIYSHPEALKQCRRYLQKHHWEQVACRNTAIAAESVAGAGEPGAAAIASAYAARRYGLEVLEENISDSQSNATWFVVIASAPEYDAHSSQISVTFTTAHRSGALCETLMPFMAQGLNLVRIESRPGMQGSYRFFADLEGNILDEGTAFALRQAEAACEYFEVIGCYDILSEGNIE